MLISSQAALFSGVNSAFIIMSLALLTPSSADTTNALLHLLIQRMDNSTAIPSNVYPAPSLPGLTRVNCFFGASLACSLLSALGAMIGKQWLIYYDRAGEVDPLRSTKYTPSPNAVNRGRERLRKLRGLQRWQIRGVLEACLPTLLQLAVVIFFIGLIDFTFTVNSPVGWVTLGIAVLGLAFYLITVGAAMWDEDCPFQTPVSTIILPFFGHCFGRLLFYLAVSFIYLYDFLVIFLIAIILLLGFVFPWLLFALFLYVPFYIFCVPIFWFYSFLSKRENFEDIKDCESEDCGLFLTISEPSIYSRA